ncbi:DUF4192 domain-containing protein [Corynebacterium sp. ES2730-CONJ]|uniref:DUF4192 domain-containing protein n=1 Tax=Corynebacterium sp. ES2730-CONJ TaxID=2973941 RepID=UPI00216B3511|nr:DUF4192 domain-containing protein [Corynebacterium sp. ES2730-CONJ]MCS4531121.1 DUF4192 domain-containing protein [Corynebacterium sp. ES2730-CONJ]
MKPFDAAIFLSSLSPYLGAPSDKRIVVAALDASHSIVAVFALRDTEAVPELAEKISAMAPRYCFGLIIHGELDPGPLLKSLHPLRPLDGCWLIPSLSAGERYHLAFTDKKSNLKQKGFITGRIPTSAASTEAKSRKMVARAQVDPDTLLNRCHDLATILLSIEADPLRPITDCDIDVLAQFMGHITLRDAVLRVLFISPGAAIKLAHEVAARYGGDIRANALCCVNLAHCIANPNDERAVGELDPHHRLSQLIYECYTAGKKEELIEAAKRGCDRTWLNLLKNGRAAA